MFYMAELYTEKCIFKYNQDQRKLFNEANQNAYKEQNKDHQNWSEFGMNETAF